MVSATKEPQSIVLLTDTVDFPEDIAGSMKLEGFKVNVYPRNSEHLDQLLSLKVDLIIVESSHFSLEELSQFSHIRSCHHGLLAILTVQLEEMLQVMMYEQGIDALLFKPMQPILMLAQIRALFRRVDRHRPVGNLAFDGLEINGSVRRVAYLGDEIELSSREFDLLYYLAQNACQTLDRDCLYKNIFGVEYNGYDRSIDMYISRIRTKLTESTSLPPMIKTVRGKGYLFTSQ